MEARWAEIKTIWKQNQWLYVVSGFGLGVLCQPFLASISEDVGVFLRDIVPEAIGIVFTVLIIDRIYQGREAAREERELKARLIREFGGKSNETVKSALDELRDRGWTTEATSLLKNKDFRYSNMRGVDLWNVNLEGSILRHAKLDGTVLWRTNLRGAELRGASLVNARFQGAILENAILPDGTVFNGDWDYLNRFVNPDHTLFWQGHDLQSKDLSRIDFTYANLQGAIFRSSILWGAILKCADLRGTDLRNVNLIDADLQNSQIDEWMQFDENTTLPDGSKWTPDTDLRRFTDPTHPQFWRSDDPKSPAYRGE